MQRDREYLLDILEAAKLALAYVSGKTREEFLQNTQCQDAVVRRLEIIGEASRRVSSETQEALPSIPWQSIIAMRNRIIHEYNDVDWFIVWDTVWKDLPRLVEVIERFVSSGEET